MSMTLALACGHGLQLRDGDDTREENLPPKLGGWTFYPLNEQHCIELGDIMTCLTCQTNRAITAMVEDRLIPIDEQGRLIFEDPDSL
jgi:hypothetical protein